MAKRFTRIEAGKKIGGVCTGLADYFNLDVTLVRVLFVVLVLASVGSAAIAYIILWAVAPSAPHSGAAASGAPHPGTAPPASGPEPRS
jgi:phage shock protein PspC (stress-responsive transcriptional regulator)